ncbi:MAG: hypothetical protein ACOVP1_11550 [Bacteroidia bacterium]
MILRNRIAEIRSKKDVDILVNELEAQPEFISELLNLLKERQERQSLYASWVLAHLAENAPELLNPFIQYLFELFERSPHTGVNRNVMRCFMEIDIPDSIMSPLIDQCILFIHDPNQPVAVKAFSLITFARIVLKVPELAPELKLAMENLHLHQSAALHSSSKKVRLMMKKNGINF